MAGNQEENGEQSAQRESRGTAEDVEENRRKMWEVKATDAVCRNVIMQRGMELLSTSAPVDICRYSKMLKRRWKQTGRRDDGAGCK